MRMEGHLRNIEEATAAFANERFEQLDVPDQSGCCRTLSFHISGRICRALPPIRGGMTTDRWQQLFNQLGCASCHRPSFQSLERQKAFPYTDLLLHDMGPALADGIDQGSASARDFKTPPLWGIAKTGPPYLHDGRAKTMHDAIRLHGGEAERSVAEYLKLRDLERAAVLAFLRSL
jgi:CxxC motif-containing protein (DUF1111 family)